MGEGDNFSPASFSGDPPPDDAERVGLPSWQSPQVYGYNFFDGGYNSSQALRDPSIMSAQEEAQLEFQLRQQGFKEWEIKQKLDDARKQRAIETRQFQQQMGLGRDKFDWDKERGESELEIAKRRQKLEQDKHKLSQWEAYREMATAPKSQWIQSGLLSEGKVPAPPEWLKNAGMIPQSTSGKQSDDWTSRVRTRVPGAQDRSQMTPEQRQMTQGLFGWQGRQIPATPSAFMSQAPSFARSPR